MRCARGAARKTDCATHVTVELRSAPFVRLCDVDTRYAPARRPAHRALPALAPAAWARGPARGSQRALTMQRGLFLPPTRSISADRCTVSATIRRPAVQFVTECFDPGTGSFRVNPKLHGPQPAARPKAHARMARAREARHRGQAFVPACNLHENRAVAAPAAYRPFEN